MLQQPQAIGIAMHMHLESKNTFPDGWSWFSDDDKNNGGNEATWITRLLPYCEQTALDASIDWTQPLGHADAGLQTVISGTQVSMFLCPSNDRVGNVCSNAYARGTYAANNGIGPMRESTFQDLPPKRTLGTVTDISLAGTFFMNSRLTPADVKDGLSATAFVSEIRAVPGEDMRGVLHYPEGPFFHHNYTPNSSVPDEIRQGLCVSVTGALCIETFNVWINRMLTMTARSAHPGGVNLLLGDGSVHFVSDSIDLNVWQAACTPRAIPGEVTFIGL